MMAHKERNVIVFSRTPLFGEGLGRLLADQKGLKILGVASTLSEVRSLTDQINADVIILNRIDAGKFDGQTLADLLDITKEQVLAFSLADRDMIIYTRKRVPASIRELLNALGETNAG